jgi:ribosomal protein L7Ae-like RNA K-turn-binding protein
MPNGKQGNELDKRLSEGRAKFVALSKDVESEILVLSVAPHVNLTSTTPVEKCMKERYLEALANGCSTAKEVCRRLNPSMDQFAAEKKRQSMKATSMFLLRLSNSSEGLVERSE